MHGELHVPGFELHLWRDITGKEFLPGMTFTDRADLLYVARTEKRWVMWETDRYVYVPMDKWRQIDKELGNV
tara:strand:+ start:271303 stop:271518 length:216 start_codon:yes stop_codon:yes gene_type:complete